MSHVHLTETYAVVHSVAAGTTQTHNAEHAHVQSKWKAQQPFASQMYEKRVAKLQQGAAPLYSTQGRNDANENSAVMISFQVRNPSMTLCVDLLASPHLMRILWT